MRRAKRSLTVHKFGGASLADGAALRNALSLVVEGTRPAVVVISALAGVTDDLLEVARLLKLGDDGGVRTTLTRVRERYLAAARAAIPSGRRRRELYVRIHDAFRELDALTRVPRFVRELSPAALDQLLSRGEELAARVFSAGLPVRGVPSEFVSALRLVATDGRPGQASPDLARTDRNVRTVLQPILRRRIVPVVPGFLGAAPDGHAVTLGRGGSDLTATLLGRALSAKVVLLWKDVAGFLTADPRVVPDARVIPQLNIREAAELAYYGAKVLHPRALIPVMGRRVPIVLRPFGQPQAPGTEISLRRTLSRYPVKALSAVSGQALVTVSGNGMLGVPGIAARTFAALNREGISVSLISQASSEHSICASLPEAAAEQARRSLLEAFAEEIRRHEIDGIEVLRNLATISVVGLGMAGTPGIASRVFSALAAAGINVVAIAQGSSELNISFVVQASQASQALRRIHDAFALSKIGGGAVPGHERADVVLLGFGQVGRELAKLLPTSRRKKVRLIAVIDRSGFVFRPEGLSARTLAELSASKARGRSVARASGGRRASPADALAFLSEHALKDPTLVDVTAENTTSLLEKAAASGFNLVLANKRPLSGRRIEAEKIERAVRRGGRRLRSEATVGAGLPILDTYRKLAESGDRISKIEGCLSGTLGFLLTELERGRPFSESLRRAVEEGYTEPDPRDDLSGADVARKALILGRLLGFRGEPDEVAVESLVPEKASRIPLRRFLEGLEDYDEAWADRMARARDRGRVLRYVVSVTRRSIRVGLTEVPAGSAFAGLKGSDNLVSFTTARYRSNPLVIQGPGAGLAVTAAGIFNDIMELAGA